MTAPRFRCPVCRKDVMRESTDFPFCSSRCRTIDLGRWAAGEYCIAGEPVVLSEQQPDDERY